jgi:hypothetical protein
MPLGKALKERVLHTFIHRHALSSCKKYHDGRKICHEVSQTKASSGGQIFSLHMGFAGLPPTCNPPALLLRGTQEGGKRVRTAKEARNGCTGGRRTVNNRRFSERRYCSGGRRTAYEGAMSGKIDCWRPYSRFDRRPRQDYSIWIDLLPLFRLLNWSLLPYPG